MSDFSEINSKARDILIGVRVRNPDQDLLVVEELFTHLKAAGKAKNIEVGVEEGFFSRKLIISYGEGRYNPLKEDSFWTMEQDSIGRCIILANKGMISYKYRNGMNILSVRIK